MPFADDPIYAAAPLAVNNRRTWSLGPLSLEVSRSQSGLTLRASQSSDPLDPNWKVEDEPEHRHGEDIQSAPGKALERFISGVPQGAGLTLRPKLADRVLVAQHPIEVLIPGSSEFEVFLSTPLWFELLADNAALIELPSWRPSDTWFGPNTRQGVIAYAGRTTLRTSLDALTSTRARAYTKATMVNPSPTPFSLRRIALPLPLMQAYTDADDRVWTDSVRVLCGAGPDAQVSIQAPLSIEGDLMPAIAPARVRGSGDGMVRAFSAVLEALG